MKRALLFLALCAVVLCATAFWLGGREACASGYCPTYTCFAKGMCGGSCHCIKTGPVEGFCAEIL